MHNHFDMKQLCHKVDMKGKIPNLHQQHEMSKKLPLKLNEQVSLTPIMNQSTNTMKWIQVPLTSMTL